MVAKFRINSMKTYTPTADYATVEMVAVHPSEDDDQVTRDENARYWTATPSGTISMTVNNPTIVRQLVPGDCYYVDFRKA